MTRSATIPMLFYEVYGCSPKGNLMKRNDEYIRCGCYHRTQEEAEVCLRRFRDERIGDCQRYRVVELEVRVVKRKAVGS